MVIFNSYVKLPEGKYTSVLMRAREVSTTCKIAAGVEPALRCEQERMGQ